MLSEVPAPSSLERQLLYKRLATAETAEVMVYYAWTIVTVAIGWGVWGLATAVVARAVVGTAVTVALSPIGIVWPGYDRRRIRAILGIGIRVQAVEFVVAVRDQILVLGTTVVGSVSIVAYWSVVLRALQAPGMLLWGADARVLPGYVSDQVRRPRPGQHAATPLGGLNNPRRDAARPASRCRTGSRAATVRREVVSCGWSALVSLPCDRHPRAGSSSPARAISGQQVMPNGHFAP